jgi:2',3'-cyclic-nucleotide 2'-phosphodiesterase (5'-nucleotidase family)
MQSISPDKALRAIMADVRRARPDIIILAQHMGKYWQGGNIYKLAAAYPEIDLILGGHIHKNLSGEKIGPGNWFVEAGAHGNCLGKITIDYSNDLNKVPKITSELIKVTRQTPVDSGLENLLRSDLNKLQITANRKVGKVYLQYSARKYTALPSIIAANAMQQATKADAVIYCAAPKQHQYPFTVHISEYTLFKWFRYQNSICTIDLSHDEFMKVIEELLNRKTPNREIPFVTGAKVFMNNKKIRSVKFAGKVNPAKIKVAFTSYTLSGCSGRYKYLRSLADNPENHIFDSKIILRNAVRKYITAHPELKIKYTNWLYKTSRKGLVHAIF